MADSSSSTRLVRASVASLVCAATTIVTATLLATRHERAPALVAVNGGFALAAAIFATASATAVLRSRDGEATNATNPQTREALRATFDRIARVAQAGTFGDPTAAEHAFALIARQAREATARLDGSARS